MAFIDYYKILGVDKNIPQKDVRAAYRKRAKLFHPDLHPNDPKAKAKFQALNEAYDVISDNMARSGNRPMLFKGKREAMRQEILSRDLISAATVKEAVVSQVSFKIYSVVAHISAHRVLTMAHRVAQTAGRWKQK